MKRLWVLFLLICLALSFSAGAEYDVSNNTSSEDAYKAVKALLTGDPDMTPEQAQSALAFLTIIHTKLGEALLNNGKDSIIDAVGLLTFISKEDPDLCSRILDAVPDTAIGNTPAAYILNIRSNRFHRPECTGLSDMSEKNRVDFFGSRDILLATGFKACQICSP